MIKPLNDEAKRKLFPHYGEECFSNMSGIVDSVARKAESEILMQVVEWGKDQCPHHYHFIKRQCSECWQELKKLTEEK